MPTVTGIATEFITFTRASNATVTDSDGKVKWAPHNLLLASESFDAASWTKSNATIAANSAVAPNGTTTADKVYPTINGIGRGVNQRVLIDGPTNYSVSVYAKAAGKNFIAFTDLAAADFRAWVNLSTGAKTETAGYFVTVTSVGNGWYNCVFTQTATAANPYAYVVVCDADSSAAVTVNGTDGVHLWGAHLYRSDLGGMQPNTSAYPMYNPTTPKNLLGFTENLTTGWTNSNTTDAIVSEVNPVGLTGAVDVAATAGNGTLLSSLSLLASPYTFSVWLKRKTGSGTVEITVDGTTYVAAAVTGTWTRFSTTLTPTAGTKTPGIRLVTSGDAVYAWGAQLSDSASLDPYVPVYGAAVTSAAYYGPRRDFDGSTLACKGLLVEEQRANLVLQSAAFDTASWDKFSLNTTGTPQWVNAATAPDGTMTADKIIPSTTSTNFHAIQSAAAITVANATAHTWSVYAKADGYDWLAVVPYTNTVSYFTWFNVATGAVGTNAAGNTAHPPVAVGNGWYRLSVTRTTASTGSFFILYAANGDNQPTFAGDGTKGVLVWGAQLEAGSFATSYIPTGSASATRNADVASVSTQAFPYSATEGTIVVAWQLAQLSGSPAAIHLTDAAESNRIRINAHLAGLNRSTITAAGALVDNIDTSTAATGITKYAIGGKSADYAVYRNGSAGGTSANAGFPSGCTEMRIGRDAATGNFNGHIRQITYLPRRISNTDLVTRTSA